MLVAAGAWAHRDVRRALERERVAGIGGAVPAGKPIRSAADARAMAETIREKTLEATGGVTYAEAPSFVTADGVATGSAADAAQHPVTGAPMRNPDVDLWLQSMTLQSALMQAYMGFRVAELTAAIGTCLGALGVGVALTARR